MIMISYASLEEANDYHLARQSASQWDELSPIQKQQRLTSASDLIDRLFTYKGQAAAPEQIRAFPRVLPPQTPAGALFKHDVAGDKPPIAILPECVKMACCELALLNDISGCLNDAIKVKNLGGVLMQTGQCKGDDKDWRLAVLSAQKLLAPLMDKRCFAERA